jgi:hypothetical protein
MYTNCENCQECSFSQFLLGDGRSEDLEKQRQRASYPQCFSKKLMKITYPQKMWKSYPHFPQPRFASSGYPQALWITYPHFHSYPQSL